MWVSAFYYVVIRMVMSSSSWRNHHYIYPPVHMNTLVQGSGNRRRTCIGRIIITVSSSIQFSPQSVVSSHTNDVVQTCISVGTRSLTIVKGFSKPCSYVFTLRYLC